MNAIATLAPAGRWSVSPLLRALATVTMLIALSTAVALLFSRPVYAQEVNTDYFWTGGTNADIRGELALGDADPRQVIANIINVVLGFLGILAVIIIIAAGFRFLTSGGNDEARGKATSMLVSGLIGLVIVLAAYSIARFVIDSLVTATGAG